MSPGLFILISLNLDVLLLLLHDINNKITNRPNICFIAILYLCPLIFHLATSCVEIHVF